MQRTCKTEHYYGGKVRTPGEKFDVQPGDLEFEIETGRVEREDGDPVPGYKTRDMVAARGTLTLPRRSSTQRRGA